MIGLADAMGVDLPKGHTALEARPVLASMALGVGITMPASILPARRATRVAPIAAVREGATLPPTRLAGQSHNAGVVVAAASLVAIALGVFVAGVSATAVAALVGGGTLGLLIGIALLAPRRVCPLSPLAAVPSPR